MSVAPSSYPSTEPTQAHIHVRAAVYGPMVIILLILHIHERRLLMNGEYPMTDFRCVPALEAWQLTV